MAAFSAERFGNVAFALVLLAFLGGAGMAAWHVVDLVGVSSCPAGEPRSFVRPLPECSDSTVEGVTIGERITLAENIEEYVDEAKEDGRIADAAVYFRDLSEGPWFGVDEDAEFVPASLNEAPARHVVLQG